MSNSFLRSIKITPLRRPLSIFIDNLGNHGSQMAVRGFPLSGNYVTRQPFWKGLLCFAYGGPLGTRLIRRKSHSFCVLEIVFLNNRTFLYMCGDSVENSDDFRRNIDAFRTNVDFFRTNVDAFHRNFVHAFHTNVDACRWNLKLMRVHSLVTKVTSVELHYAKWRHVNSVRTNALFQIAIFVPMAVIKQ